MIRAATVLVLTGGSLLAASFATGLAGADSPRSAAPGWRATHRAVSVGTVTAVLGIHMIFFASFGAATRRAEALCRAEGMPSWPAGQVSRNARRASRFILTAAATVVVAGGLGAIVDPDGAGGDWHLGAASFALGFNVVAFLIELAAAASNRRLLADMEAWGVRADGPGAAVAATTEASA